MTGQIHRRAFCLAGSATLLAACTQSSGAQPVAAKASETATRGLDAAMLANVAARAGELPRLHALIAARHGQTLAEHSFRGRGLDQPINIKSASKSVLSALTGIAIDKGVLSGVDQKIAPILRADIPTNADPRIEDIEVGHLLSMRAGLRRTSGEFYGAWVTSPNWVRHALSRPFVGDPGGQMIYSTGSSHLMSAVLTKASGRSTHVLAREWLAEPLEVNLPAWPKDPQGIFFGGNDMLISPRALLRFGEMYRLGGRIDGKQIVPAAWIEESWLARTASPWSGNDYGYGWFSKQVGEHDVYFAWGYGGQMLFIAPDLELTVVMISDPNPHPRAESHLSTLHALLDQGIIPAAIRGAAA